MKKRLFWYTTLTLFVGLLCYFGVSLYITHNNNINLAKDAVVETTQICANLYSEDTDLAAFVAAGEDTRITVIAKDGTVLADTNPLNLDALENHLNRPEVQAAINGAPEAFIRYSNTVGADLMFYALQAGETGSEVVIRVGIPIARVDGYLFSALPILIFILLAIVVLSFFFVRRIIGRITKPFEVIETKLRVILDGENAADAPEVLPEYYEEIKEITHSIDEVAGLLKENLGHLKDEKTKLDYILNNIGDGLFVVNENSDIELVNAAVLEIFGANNSVMHKNISYLSYQQELAAAIDESTKSAKSMLFEMPLHGNIYSVAVKRLPKTMLTMVVLQDVTESRENAKRREEFFANASHELKTPLTAIRGFNELAEINNKDESISKYLSGITRETDRMMLLIADMLKLSQLENLEIVSPTDVSLAKTAEEVREALAGTVGDKNIEFTISGDATVYAEESHVYELIKNLAENAVRYNIVGGTVTISVENSGNAPKMVVTDNGIGIPREDQTRIFERFYRVEKSRSQNGGGTGLGLSIAKHICVLYGWQLNLKSKLGVGTNVSIHFGTAR